MSASHYEDGSDVDSSEGEMDTVLLAAASHHRRSIESLRQSVLKHHIGGNSKLALPSTLPRVHSSEGIPVHKYSNCTSPSAEEGAVTPTSPGSPRRSPLLSPRASYLQFRLEKLLNDDAEIRNNYGLQDLREE